MQQKSWWSLGGVFVMLKVSRQSDVALHAFVTCKLYLCGSWELDERQWLIST